MLPTAPGAAGVDTYGDFRGLQTEIDELTALLDASGAHLFFCLGASAVTAIETALVCPDITKLALYGPAAIIRRGHPWRVGNPLSVGVSVQVTWTGLWSRSLRTPAVELCSATFLGSSWSVR
jgi:hypothetical protein